MKILVTTQAFATPEEILVAMHWTKHLIEQSKDNEVLLYLGEYNYGMTMQKYIPAEKTAFYQPNMFPNEFIFSFDLPKSIDVQGVRWHQSEEKLKIQVQIEPTKTDFTPKIDIQSRNMFSEVHIIGDYKLEWIENYPLVEKFTQISKALVKQLFNEKPLRSGLLTSNQIAKKNYPSLLSTISDITKNKFELPKYSSNTHDYSLLSGLWLNTIPREKISERWRDLQNIILLSPGMLPSFEIENLYENQKLKEKIFISTANTIPNIALKGADRIEFRKFDDLLLARGYFSDSSSEERVQDVKTIKPLVNTNINKKPSEITKNIDTSETISIPEKINKNTNENSLQAKKQVKIQGDDDSLTKNNTETSIIAGGVPLAPADELK